MKIHNFFYNEDTTILSIDFSTKEDGDDFYRNLSLTIDEVNFFYSEYISEDDLVDVSDDVLWEIISNYCENNDLPEQIIL